jgi:hypothetical protein
VYPEEWLPFNLLLAVGKMLSRKTVMSNAAVDHSHVVHMFYARPFTCVAQTHSVFLEYDSLIN